MKKQTLCKNCKCISFTQEQIKVLKEMAQERIDFVKTFLCDEHGKRYPYRNRFETWEDAHTNLKHLGFSEEEIIKQIGRKK